jgi:2-keto-4-pentenoate hydratase/2-oxohepta-3-ene-1,7-dioic acid hydratase in catechol pathway
MKIQRRQLGGLEYYVQLADDGSLVSVSQSLDSLLQGRGLASSALVEKLSSAEGRVLSPVPVGKIVAIGLNYRAHAAEFNKPLPEEPLIFMKPASAVIAHLEPILLPPQSQEVHFEGELAVIIGKTAKDVTAAAAAEHILGYTICNDVTARDIQRREGKYTRAKGFDTFAPLGPCLVTDLDPLAATIETWVNHERRQLSPCNDMIFSIPELVAFVSSVMTLSPFDVITTGTPSGVGPITHGDTVRISITGIGTLENPVRARVFGSV